MKAKVLSEGELLLRAVLTNPREDTPRLVYADWLEENAKGQPDRDRAEFIRLGIEFEGMEEGPKKKKVGARIKTLFNTNVYTENKHDVVDSWADYRWLRITTLREAIQLDGIIPSKMNAKSRTRRGFPYWLSMDSDDIATCVNSWFKGVPYTMIYVYDRQPLIARDYSAAWVDAGSEWVTDDPYSLPTEVYDLLPYCKSVGNRKVYSAGVEAGLEGLSIACLRLCRKLNDLPHSVKDCDLFV